MPQTKIYMFQKTRGQRNELVFKRQMSALCRLLLVNKPPHMYAPSLKQSLPQPTNVTKKPIDSSARNPLIYIGMAGVPSGLRPVLGGAGRRENTQTESKTCRLLAEMVLSEVRKNPQEPAQTRGSRQKKANPEGLVFPLLVELGGFEPPSISLFRTVLHV